MTKTPADRGFAGQATYRDVFDKPRRHVSLDLKPGPSTVTVTASGPELFLIPGRLGVGFRVLSQPGWPGPGPGPLAPGGHWHGITVTVSAAAAVDPCQGPLRRSGRGGL